MGRCRRVLPGDMEQERGWEEVRWARGQMGSRSHHPTPRHRWRGVYLDPICPRAHHTSSHPLSCSISPGSTRLHLPTCPPCSHRCTCFRGHVPTILLIPLISPCHAVCCPLGRHAPPSPSPHHPTQRHSTPFVVHTADSRHPHPAHTTHPNATPRHAVCRPSLPSCAHAQPRLCRCALPVHVGAGAVQYLRILPP